MTPQELTALLAAEHQRGYHQGYQAGHREGSLTPAQREERDRKMQSMVLKRLADKPNGGRNVDVSCS